MDANRQRDVVITDMRVEKEFTIAGPLRASGVFDIFNLFNSNAEERINWTAGSAFLRPLQVIPPRVARVALKLTY